MPFETPRLDDREFKDLVEEARRRIPLYSPEWTDHNLSDPGITMIELFAWMVDIVLYRLNRVPDKHYIKFMELIGMRLREAEPARVPVTFWLSAPQPNNVAIPAGTAVSTVRTETDPAIIFTTDIEMDILVPKLTAILTSPGGQRKFKSYNVRGLNAGGDGVAFLVFESPEPKPGDVVYLGFEEDLSHHLLGIEMDVDGAAGAGIDPLNPPYVWEVMTPGGEQGWTPVEVDQDGTRGFNESGLVRLFLPAMGRGTRNDVTAYWLRCRLAPVEGAVSYRVSPRIRRLVTNSWGITADTTNVVLVRNEVLGRSDGTPGQFFEFEHTPLMPRIAGEHLTLRIEEGNNIREERWTEVSDFADSGEEDRHYTIDSGAGELRLGPALRQRDGTIQRYGRVAPKESQLVMRAYRYGGGQAGNVATRTLNVLKTALPYIAAVTNRSPAYGGLDAEDLDNSKLRVPGYLRSLGRAVTAADFEYLAREAKAGAIARVYCLQPPLTAAGEVKVLVIPHVPQPKGFIAPESLALPEDLRARITAYLDERRLLSTRLEVLSPVYQWVQTEIRFRPTIHANPDEVRRLVEDKLYGFLSPLSGGLEGTGWPFGRTLRESDVSAALLTVPGVDYIQSVKLYPVSYEGGEFKRGDEATEIEVPAHGVIASYEHVVHAV